MSKEPEDRTQVGVLVGIDNTHPELLAEMLRYPPRRRADRMRALASKGLLMQLLEKGGLAFVGGQPPQQYAQQVPVAPPAPLSDPAPAPVAQSPAPPAQSPELESAAQNATDPEAVRKVSSVARKLRG